MLTECPSCHTVFRVTSAILKMGRGQVRCGKCRTQFDALESLMDEDESPLQIARTEQSPQPPVEQTSEIVDDNAESASDTSFDDAVDAAAENWIDSDGRADPDDPDNESYSQVDTESPVAQGEEVENTEILDDDAEEPQIAEEITMEGTRFEISGRYRVSNIDATTKQAESRDQEQIVIERDGHDTAEFERDADNDAEQVFDIDINDERDDETVDEAAHHLLNSQQDAEPETMLPLSQRIWKRMRHRDEAHREHREIAAELDALTQGRRRSPQRRGLWNAGAVVLTLTLITQLVYHYRDPLVRSPKWGPTITRIYHALGLTLTPHWNLAAYELQQWGVVSDPGAHDALRVRASVTNTADFAQPYPYVRLSMQDRWGATVAARAFAPDEYLSASSIANRMMAPHQRTNAEIVVIDPGADAVGFQIHACLPPNSGQDSGLVCSDSLPATQ